MQFREWLLSELRLAPEIRRLSAKFGTFYVDEKGVIRSGYPGGSWSPYFEIHPGERRIMFRNIAPTSKLFRDIINAIRVQIPDIESWEVEQMNLSHALTGKVGRQVGPHSSLGIRNLDRHVGHWLREKPTDFRPGALPKYLYHGTSTELWYEGIKQRGLLPRLQTSIGVTGSYGASGALSHGNKVYLSTHPDNATRGAAKQAANAHGGEPLILRISTKGLEWTKFDADEDMQSQVTAQEKLGKKVLPAHVTAQGMGTVAYTGKIPPRLVEPFLLGVYRTHGNGIYYQWRKFEDVPRHEHPLTVKIRNSFEKQHDLSSHDSPYFYALFDRGIITKERFDSPSGWRNDRFVVKKELPDKEVRQLIKDSSWVKDADEINKDMNAWGTSGIGELHYHPATVDNEKDQAIIDMLLKAKVYLKDGEILSYYRYDSVPKAIALAKELHARRMTYDQLKTKIKEMADRTRS